MFQTLVAQSGDNTLSGGATEVTALAILAELEKQSEFSESIWIDATGTFFIRRVVYSENLETYTVEYTLADGTTYVPTAPIEPASSGTDREIVQTSYTVTTSGTGYSIGDIVQQINIFDVGTDTLQSTIWYNQTTDAIISPAPNIAHLQPEGSVQSIAAATGTQADVAYTTGNGTIISLLKGLFGKLGTLGQKNMAGSAPVVIASDQSAIPTSQSGTWNITNISGTISLPTGAATETTLATLATESTLSNIESEISDVITGIGLINETAPTTDTASSGLNGRLQRIAQLLSRTIAPAATQSTANFYSAAAVTVDTNSTATATVGSNGGRYIQVTNNSGVICDITIGGTSGGSDGTTILTAIAGDSISMPMDIAASAVLRIKPRVASLTSSDIVAVRIT